MSNHTYKVQLKIDKKNKFRAVFDGNTGFYRRTSVLEKTSDGKYRETDKEVFRTDYPELIDIGIMEKCVCSHKCKVDCYQKAISRTGENMSLKDFTWLIEQSRGKVFQVALGGAGDPDTHEDFAEILKVCADNNIVPNFTTSGITFTEEKVALCKEYCGAVAVSEHNEVYTDNAVKMLLDAGVTTNMHYVLSTKTIDRAIRILNGEEAYRPGINAVVFLLYKPVGLGKEEYVLKANDERVAKFFEALDNRKVDFNVGFDSCTCSGLINFAHNYNKEDIDYCEGGRFSMYISADMTAMPCSFANQNKAWFFKLNREQNIGIKDAWDSEVFNKFRNRLLSKCPNCSNREYCGGGCPLLDSVCLCSKNERTYNEDKSNVAKSILIWSENNTRGE